MVNTGLFQVLEDGRRSLVGTKRNTEHRQYPIGALSANEVAGIRANPLCEETVTFDALMQEWNQKVTVFNSLPVPNIAATDSDIQPLTVSPAVKQKVDDVISSYKGFLPPSFDLGFVPIEKLVTPQKSVILERARNAFGG